jgi:hypothetical protein
VIRAGDVSFPAVLAIRRLTAALLLAVAVVACSAGATPTPAPTTSPTQPPATQPPAPSATAGPSASQPPSGSEIKCDLGGHDAAYHIHALVGVRVDGQLYSPPANIGIGSDCMYWVHTHNTDAIVHIEAPAEVHPTLGDFLDIWAKTFPDDPLLKDAHDAIAAGKVTVNDAAFSGDALGLVLEDRMRIILGS